MIAIILPDNNNLLPPQVPTVTTDSVYDITSVSAYCAGDVTSNGGATVLARGVCWDTAIDPTTANHVTYSGFSIGSFTGSMDSLSMPTTYYARAFAVNSVGTAYGNNIVFTPAVSYHLEVQPVFTANCEGCHNGIVWQTPVLTAGLSYNSLFSYPFYIDSVNPPASDLYIKIHIGYMANYSPAGFDALVLSWI